MSFKHLRETLCVGLLGIIGFLPINQIQAETTGSEHDQTLADHGGGGHGGGGHGGGDHGWSGGGHNWDGGHNWSGGGYHDGHYGGGYYGGGYYGGPAVGVGLGGVGVSTGYQEYPYYDGYSYSTTPNVYINGGYGGGYGAYGRDGWHGSDYHGWHGDSNRSWQGGGSRGTSERSEPGTGYNRGGGGMRR